jgi:hypothetical protein
MQVLLKFNSDFEPRRVTFFNNTGVNPWKDAYVFSGVDCTRSVKSKTFSTRNLLVMNNVLMFTRYLLN